MSGWQRFFLLFLSCIGILILFPQYDSKGITFMGMAFILWTCIIILFSVLMNLFAIIKLDQVHRIFSLVFLGVMFLSLLYYFPLVNGQTPIKRLQQHQWPTQKDVQEGVKRLTFNFDFARRNVHRDSNYINQHYDKADEKKQEVKKEIKKTVKKTEQVLDILVEDVEENK